MQYLSGISFTGIALAVYIIVRNEYKTAYNKNVILLYFNIYKTINPYLYISLSN